MEQGEPKDSWLNDSRATTWDEVLRPPKPSSRVLLPLIAVGAVAIASVIAYIVWNGTLYQTESSRLGSESRSATSRPTMVPPPAQEAKKAPSPPLERVQRLTKCRSASGVVAYSDGTCPSGSVESELLVKPDSNLADGLSVEAREASMRQNSAIAQSVLEHERRVAANVDVPGAECAQLSASIASLDALARQPLSAVEQDRLKDQRQRMRDRQFRLRCS